MDILKPVLESYARYNVEKQKTPNYVGMYTKSIEDIVLVYNKTKQTSTTGTITGNNKKNESEELELTGSPLKLDLSLHTILDDTMISDEPQLWTKEEGFHCPINIDVAREIANLYNKNRDLVTEEDAVPMWILINPSDENKPLLLMVHSDKHHFGRGIVTYEGSLVLDDVDVDQLIEDYAKQERLTSDMITIQIDCKYLISGISYGCHNTDELLNAPHGGSTELRCEWTTKTLHTPFISCKVNLVSVMLKPKE